MLAITPPTAWAIDHRRLEPRSAVLAFAVGLFLWIFAAVNLGYLSP
jgi:hypothetical protein